MAASFPQGQSGRNGNFHVASKPLVAAVGDINNHGGVAATHAVKTPFSGISASAPPPAKRIRASASGSDSESPFPEWPRSTATPKAAAPAAPTNGVGSGSRTQPPSQNAGLAAATAATAATARRSVPSGFKVTVEGEREVLVLDDDDDDDDARLDGLPSVSTINSISIGKTPRDVPARAPQPPARPAVPAAAAVPVLPAMRPAQPRLPSHAQLARALAVPPNRPTGPREPMPFAEPRTPWPLQSPRSAQPVQQSVRPVQSLRFPQPTQPAQIPQNTPQTPQTPRPSQSQPGRFFQSPRPTQPAQQSVYNSPRPKEPLLQRGPISEETKQEHSPRLKTEGASVAPDVFQSVPALVSSSDVRTPISSKRNQIGLPAARQRPSTFSFTRFATLPRRPYLQLQHREFVAKNDRTLLKKYVPSTHPGPVVIHVDFTPEEVQAVLKTARAVLSGKATKKSKSGKPDRELKHLLNSDAERISLVARECSIKGRQAPDVAAFLVDMCSSRGRHAMRLTTPRALTLQREDRSAHEAADKSAARSSQFSSLLLAREVAGTLAPGRTRQLVNFPNAFRTLREDSLALCHEWTNCAGDVTTLSWTSEETFVCGTTTHMDNRNHQYNRQGNLAVGSVTKGTLRAYPDHRIARSSAIAAAGPDQTAAAAAEHSIRYDDPWLYTSVVSSDFVPSRNIVFTSGFDKTVKLWRINHANGTMSLVSNWYHTGKVNFVVASLDEPCLVATASDVATDAVRIYRLPPLEGSGRVKYKSLSCSRIFDLEGRPVVPDRWAYFPAAVRWGLAPGTRHLLLVGYSPRGLSDNADDEHIPEDRRNSGELCLWDGESGLRWRILGGTSQNVFEVAWHPTQQCFAAATSPVGNIETNVRTQVRIFRPSDSPEYGGQAFCEVQVLDCFADDINELALFPNSFSFIYAAAGCTNGRTYVWDTSQGDEPIHTLAHGPCVEELSGERISTEDTGVKFVAWGATPDRLYTGSSDGVVKVWNIRSSGQSPFVRKLLDCPASVAFGAFSPSKSRLAIGDASGRVFVLAVEDSRIEKDVEEDAFLSEAEEAEKGEDAAATASRREKTFRHHPPVIIRHATPPPPLPPAVPAPGSGLSTLVAGVKTEVSPNGSVDAKNGFFAGPAGADTGSGAARARAFLESGQLVLAPVRTVGAVKGPNYAETNLFCRSLHWDERPENPLLASCERVQQENRMPSTPKSFPRPLKDVMLPDEALLDSSSSMDLEGMDVSDDDSSGDDDGLFVSQDLIDKRALKACRRRTRDQTLALHRRNVERDLDVEALDEETRQALELADRAALLHLDDGIDYDLELDDELPADL